MDNRERATQAAREAAEYAQERRRRYKWAITAYQWARKAAQGVYDRVVPPAKRLLDSILENAGLVTAFAAVAVTAGLATVAAVQADRAQTAAVEHSHDSPEADQDRDELRQSIAALSVEIVALAERVDRIDQTPAPLLEVSPADLAGVDERVGEASAEIDRITVELAELAQASTVTTGPAPATTVDLAPDLASLAARVEAVAGEVAALAAIVEQVTATTTTLAGPTTTTAPPATTTTAAPPAPPPPPPGGGGCVEGDPACCDPAIDPTCI